MIGVIVSFDYDGEFDRERVLGVAEKARSAFEGMPELDLSNVAAALRARLSEQVETRARDARSDSVIAAFVARLRECEHQLLPVRRGRALQLLEQIAANDVQA